MTANVTTLYRHPIKGYGVEELAEITLVAGAAMPGDRVWAVRDANGQFNADAPEWVSCRNFARGAKSPQLMAVKAQTHADERLTLSHPDLPNITVDLTRAEDCARLLRWAKPLSGEGRAASVEVVAAPGVSFTDSDWPSVSIMTQASLRALSQAAGRSLSPLRFRGNIWLDGFAAWEEAEWEGRTLAIGEARLEVVEPITRCRATTANPDTGQRDTDVLGILNDRFGHQEFGMAARVVQSGRIAPGDGVRVL